MACAAGHSKRGLDVGSRRVSVGGGVDAAGAVDAGATAGAIAGAVDAEVNVAVDGAIVIAPTVPIDAVLEASSGVGAITAPSADTAAADETPDAISDALGVSPGGFAPNDVLPRPSPFICPNSLALSASQRLYL